MFVDVHVDAWSNCQYTRNDNHMLRIRTAWCLCERTNVLPNFRDEKMPCCRAEKWIILNIWMPNEQNATYITLKRFFASVASLMHLQLASAEKTFATKVTQVFFFTWMDQHVCVQCILRNKFRIAYTTRVAAYRTAVRFVVQPNLKWNIYVCRRHLSFKRANSPYRNWFGWRNCAPQDEQTK